MATTNYGLPTITGNMTADIVRDHNALAEAVDTAIDTVDDKVTSHLEQSASTSSKGHVQLTSATNSDSESLGATAKAVKLAYEKAEQAFQYGNNVKADVVAALLALDSTLPISNSSTWEQIETAIGNISTGKKFAKGTFSDKGNGQFTILTLDFTPKTVITGTNAPSISNGYLISYTAEYGANMVASHNARNARQNILSSATSGNGSDGQSAGSTLIFNNAITITTNQLSIRGQNTGGLMFWIAVE